MPRIAFPDIATYRLLEMVAYFYAQACKRLVDIQNELLHTLSEQLGRHFDWNCVAKTLAAIHKFRRAQGMIDTEETFAQLLGTIQASLGLNSAEGARKVFPSLFGYTNMTEEQQVIVLLTATMLEKLFKGLLSRMITAIPLSAKHSFRKSQGHINREHLFAERTGKSLETEIKSIGLPEFYSKWQSIRKARNEFMHGSPFAIGANAAEEAFEVAKGSFGVFAELHNKFCS